MVARTFSDLGMAYELRARLKILCPHMYDPFKKTENKQNNAAALDWLGEQ
jgi:hypothetical protein